MHKLIIKLSALSALTLLSFTAQAIPLVSNFNFMTYTGNTPRDTFANVSPSGWNVGWSDYVYINQPGTGSNSACGGTIFPSAQCPSTLNIGNYNYVQSDGNPFYSSPFSYQITGLTVGQTYSLSFWQAASQQAGFANYYPGLSTTEQWIVSLGTSGMSLKTNSNGALYTYTSNSNVFYSYTNADPTASVVQTALMNTPSNGLVDWNKVTVNLKADSTSDFLSFMAWGNNGNTINTPPIVFLAGAGNTPLIPVPEPFTLALMSVGLLALGASKLPRPAKRAA